MYYNGGMLVGINNLFLPYENKWVAMTPDRKKVVASGETIKEVDKKLKKIKNKTAILTKVLPFDKSYSP